MDGLRCIDDYTTNCLDEDHKAYFTILYNGTKQVILVTIMHLMLHHHLSGHHGPVPGRGVSDRVPETRRVHEKCSN